MDVSVCLSSQSFIYIRPASQSDHRGAMPPVPAGHLLIPGHISDRSLSVPAPAALQHDNPDSPHHPNTASHTSPAASTHRQDSMIGILLAETFLITDIYRPNCCCESNDQPCRCRKRLKITIRCKSLVDAIRFRIIEVSILRGSCSVVQWHCSCNDTPNFLPYGFVLTHTLKKYHQTSTG